MSKYQKRLQAATVETVEDENGWIHSYADLMTLLLGFFIIMYSFSKFDEKKFDDLTKELSETFKGKEALKRSESDVGFNAEQRNLISMQRMVAILNLGSVKDVHKKIEQAHTDEAIKSQVKALVTQEKSDTPVTISSEKKEHYKEIVLPDEMLFALGKHRLKPQSKKVLSEIAAKLASLSEHTSIDVIGHTDSRPVGRDHPLGDNFTLSAARAGAVARYLVDLGIKRSTINVSGMGHLEPLFPEFDSRGRVLPTNQAKNRRVHIVVKKRVVR